MRWINLYFCAASDQALNKGRALIPPASDKEKQDSHSSSGEQLIPKHPEVLTAVKQCLLGGGRTTGCNSCLVFLYSLEHRRNALFIFTLFLQIGLSLLSWFWQWLPFSLFVSLSPKVKGMALIWKSLLMFSWIVLAIIVFHTLLILLQIKTCLKNERSMQLEMTECAFLAGAAGNKPWWSRPKMAAKATGQRRWLRAPTTRTESRKWWPSWTKRISRKMATQRSSPSSN